MEGNANGSRTIVGDLYPGANILGVDLSPIQPSWVPPNVKFMVDDVESSWLRPLNYYDYIHARHTVQAIKDWPKLMQNVFEYVPVSVFPFLSSPFCNSAESG
jgi:hypothetical protein